MEETPENINGIVINEVQLLLAEKRTSLSALRTGIAVLALPLSVISVLIATSKYYNVFNVLHFLIPMGILNTALTFLGIYMIFKAIIRMRRYDSLILKIKKQHSVIGQFLD